MVHCGVNCYKDKEGKCTSDCLDSFGNADYQTNLTDGTCVRNADCTKCYLDKSDKRGVLFNTK
jgi:hypothetical protein